MKKKLTILGINGGFGQLFSNLLSNEDQFNITGIDLGSKAHSLSKCSMYLQSDLTVASAETGLTIKDAEFIIICLPENIAYKFLEIYGHQILKSTLLIDTLSVKSEIAGFYTANNSNAVSLNPMFGPDLKVEGKNIIVIKFNETEKSELFISFLATWKLNIVYLTAREHDKFTSFIQVATHTMLMAFGAAINDSGIEVSQLLKVATPPFLTTSALFGRIVSAGNKKVYWNIQNENIYAAEVRSMLIDSLTRIDKSISNKQEEDFYNVIAPKTEDQLKTFKDLSDQLFAQFKEMQ